MSRWLGIFQDVKFEFLCLNFNSYIGQESMQITSKVIGLCFLICVAFVVEKYWIFPFHIAVLLFVLVHAKVKFLDPMKD